MSRRHLLFTYGTLKRGQPNEYLIKSLKGVTYIGKGVTCKQYPLVIGGPWKLPFLIKNEGNGKNVKGDVIEVDDEALKRLDDFEDHPTWYERHMTEVELTTPNGKQPACSNVYDRSQPLLTDGQHPASGTSRLSCWVYFCNIYDEADLNSPHYEDYDSYADHGMEYDISENKEHPSNQENN